MKLLILLIVLILIGAFPTWPYSRNWGYGPVGTFVWYPLIAAKPRVFDGRGVAALIWLSIL